MTTITTLASEIMSLYALAADAVPEPMGPDPAPLPSNSVDELVSRLKSEDANTRMGAARAAGPLGVKTLPALEPLIGVMKGPSAGISKAAHEAVLQIVHYATRPGARNEAQDVAAELTRWVTDGTSLNAQQEAVRQLEFVGDAKAVPVLERTLQVPELREDARLTLERIPDRAATQALERAQKTAPDDFKPNIEQSLRHRKQNNLRTVGTDKGR